VWTLFVTQTTFNVPSLMGAVMSIGVATANSILMVTFANQRRQRGADAHTASARRRPHPSAPVLMTALAMVIGMCRCRSAGARAASRTRRSPRRAGGLLVATFATLFFVPVVYTLLRKKAPAAETEEQEPAHGAVALSSLELNWTGEFL